MSTYGSNTAPSSNTINYDSLLTQTLFNYQPTLTDNISKSNSIFYKIQENGAYESVDGGVSIQENLMYALNTLNWYSDYDELNTNPIDGVTAAFFDWAQAATPISISRKEERQNSGKARIISMIKTKIMQAEIGIKEGFMKAFLQGSLVSNPAGGVAAMILPDSNPFNGALGILPLGALVDINPARNVTIGNLNPSTATYWQNQALQSALTSANKASDLIFELDDIYSRCSKGPGGPPDLGVTDRITYNLIKTAYLQFYRNTASSNPDLPFENFMFGKMTITWDEFVPDAFNGTLTPETGLGTLYLLNTKYFAVKYDTESNFVATPFIRPANQDAKVAQILWMGNATISNRRKHGVYSKIPRSLTWAI